MEPPKIFKVKYDKGYSLCMGCGKWKVNIIFHHDKIHWILCKTDYVDYWENTDELLPDYKGYDV